LAIGFVFNGGTSTSPSRLAVSYEFRAKHWKMSTIPPSLFMDSTPTAIVSCGEPGNLSIFAALKPVPERGLSMSFVDGEDMLDGGK
jgi:hypothetical protein